MSRKGMTTSSATIVKNVLNDYVSNLHRYLGPYCFTKGAFVIEDDGSLFALLDKNKRQDINGEFRSHKSFLKDTEPIFECDIDLYLECNECLPNTKAKAHVKNIKWYPFQQGSQKYIYFKLEGHPTFSKMGTVNVSHAIQYAKKILFDKEGPCKKRREDCKPGKDCLSNAKELNHTNYQIEQEEPVAIVESHTRAGSEMFIPLGVSQFFLKNIDKKMSFQFDNGTVMISTTAPNVEIVSNATETEQEEQEEATVYEPEEPVSQGETPELPKEGEALDLPKESVPQALPQGVPQEGEAPDLPKESVPQDGLQKEGVSQDLQKEVPKGGKMRRKSMPFTVRKLPNRRLYTVKGPGRTFAKATTLKKAQAQVRLLYMIENRKGTKRRQ
jgi:hypothetical protein